MMIRLNEQEMFGFTDLLVSRSSFKLGAFDQWLNENRLIAPFDSVWLDWYKS